MARLEHSYDTVRSRIVRHWPEIRELEESVPSARTIAQLLQKAGTPSCASDAGLGDGQVREALALCHYLGGRFTVHTFGHLLAV
jgi:hypothetical protein